MFRSPWELDAHIRYRNEELVREHRRSTQIDPAPGATAGRLAETRRRIGIGIMRVGAIIAGGDALRGFSTRNGRPEFAHR